MLLNRICGFISKKSSVILLTPSAAGIGDCAVAIYFGLLKARREGKKLFPLFPHEPPGKTLFGLCNRELFNVDSPYRWRSNDYWPAVLGGWALTLLYVPICLAYRYHDKIARGALRRSVGGTASIVSAWAWTLAYAPFRLISWFLTAWCIETIPGSYPMPLVGYDGLWQPSGETRDFSWDVADSYRWPEQLDRPLPVSLHAPRRTEAERIRREMGLPQDAWFACLHVREGGFYNDHLHAAVRNASIRNYQKGIKTITDKGGWVVRMGDGSMTPLPPLPHVIDYPHTRFKSELMDIYLISDCRFYIGMLSGLQMVAVLFHKPMVLTNMYAWATPGIFLRKGDLAILKHVYSRSRRRFLPLQELLDEDWAANALRLPSDDFILSENTPEEINDVILEFLETDRDAPLSDLQREFNRRRASQARERLRRPILGADHPWDIVTRYHFSAWIQAEGALGRNFVERNWERSSKTGSTAESAGAGGQTDSHERSN